MNLNSNLDGNLSFSENNPLNSSTSQFDLFDPSPHSFQPLEISTAEPSQYDANIPERISKNYNIIHFHAQVSLICWLMMIKMTGLLFRFYLQVISNTETCVFLLMVPLLLSLCGYLGIYDKKIQVVPLAKITLVLKMTFIIPASTFIIVVLAGLVSSTPFADATHHDSLPIVRGIIHLFAFGLAMLVVYGVYYNLVTVDEVRKLQEEGQILAMKSLYGIGDRKDTVFIF